MKRTEKIKDYHRDRRNKKYKKMRAVSRKKSLVIREVSNEFLHIPEGFNYVLYFERKYVGYVDRVNQTAAVKDFTGHGFSGKWAMFYDANHRDKSKPLLTRLYLEEESDLVMLRLCHTLSIRRIAKIKR